MVSRSALAQGATVVPMLALLLGWTLFLAPADWHARREHAERVGVQTWFGPWIAARTETRAGLWQSRWLPSEAAPRSPRPNPVDEFSTGPFAEGLVAALARTAAVPRHVRHVLFRLSLIGALAPCWVPIALAALVDGWVRRRIRRQVFGAPSSLAQRLGLAALALGGIGLGGCLLWPGTVPVVLFLLLPIGMGLAAGWVITHTARV